MIDIKKPNVTTDTTSSKQIKSYLFQLVDDLNFALKNIENQNAQMQEEIKALRVTVNQQAELIDKLTQNLN
jgi:hypothetical protein